MAACRAALARLRTWKPNEHYIKMLAWVCQICKDPLSCCYGVAVTYHVSLNINCAEIVRGDVIALGGVGSGCDTCQSELYPCVWSELDEV